MIPLDIRKMMIDREKDSMSICQQCEMLSMARSTLYYTPSMANDKDLQIMKELDQLYLEDPTRGTRRMSKELQKKGYQAGRCHVRRLMQIMRLKTVYCRPRTTVIDPAKYKYPYLLRNLEITRANHPDYYREVAGHQLYTYAKRVHVPCGHYGCLQSLYFRLEFVKHHGSRMGCRLTANDSFATWQT